MHCASTSCQSGSFEVVLSREHQPSIKVDSKSLKGKFVKARIKYRAYAVFFFFFFFCTGRDLFWELSHFPQCLSACNKNIPFPSLKSTKVGKLYVQQKQRSSSSSSMQMKLALCCRKLQTSLLFPRSSKELAFFSVLSLLSCFLCDAYFYVRAYEKEKKSNHWAGTHQWPSFLNLILSVVSFLL